VRLRIEEELERHRLRMEPKHMSVKCTVSMLQNAVEEGRPIKLNSEVKEVKKETSDADMSPWERLK